MASSVARADCACCANPLGGGSVWCTTCAEESGGDGGLCASCSSNHAVGKGRFRSHVTEQRVTAEDTFLSARGLQLVSALCPTHPTQRVVLQCGAAGCSDSPFCCDLCSYGAHKGHPLKDVVEAARGLREALRHAALATTSSESTTIARVPATTTSSADDSPFVESARAGSLAVAGQIKALSLQASSASNSIAEFRDMLMSATLASCDSLTKGVEHAASTQLEIMLKAQHSWDELLDKAHKVVTDALEAECTLGSTNLLMHAPAILERLRIVRLSLLSLRVPARDMSGSKQSTD